MIRGREPFDFDQGLNLESALDARGDITCNHGNAKATPAPRNTCRRDICIAVGLLISASNSLLDKLS